MTSKYEEIDTQRNKKEKEFYCGLKHDEVTPRYIQEIQTYGPGVNENNHRLNNGERYVQGYEHGKNDRMILDRLGQMHHSITESGYEKSKKQLYFNQPGKTWEYHSRIFNLGYQDGLLGNPPLIRKLDTGLEYCPVPKECYGIDENNINGKIITKMLDWEKDHKIGMFTQQDLEDYFRSKYTFPNYCHAFIDPFIETLTKEEINYLEHQYTSGLKQIDDGFTNKIRNPKQVKKT